MANENKKYPLTVAGLYRNNYSEKLTANSMPLDQERADQICAIIQQAVGGRLIVKETAGGKTKNGKKMPDFFLEASTAEIEAERAAFAAQKKAERQEDASL